LLILVSVPAHANAGSMLPLSGTHDTLISKAALTVASLDPATLQTQWLSQFSEDQQALFKTPVCGVTVSKFEYATVGGAEEPTNASAALMTPTGAAPQCHGPRPIVLYAHGTAIDRAEDFSAVRAPGNPAYGSAIRLALIFAAQGYIVIAPNYAGYDISRLPYTPYLNEKQQAQDMLDGLTAGRQMLAQIHSRTTDGGKLFVTGYSQGGYVAMATLKALDTQKRPATAGAPMSGPYALAAAGDEVFLGHPNFGATVYLSMIANSYAHIPQDPIDLGQIFNPMYADAPTLFPGAVDRAHFDTLVRDGKIPMTAVFQTPPTGFDNLDALHEGLLSSIWLDPTHYLISTAFREAYVSDILNHPDGAAPLDGSTPDFTTEPPMLPENPENPMRRLLKANDLRNYVPGAPMLMCGANRDPEVFWNQGAGTMSAMLDSEARNRPSLRFATLDLDTRGTPGTFTSQGLTDLQNNAMQRIAREVQSAFVDHQYHNAVDKLILLLGLEGYHSAEEPYCAVAARTFFNLY
jgi:acetyl esterase/lipase